MDVIQINLTSLQLIDLRLTKSKILGFICIKDCAVLYLRPDSFRNYDFISGFLTNKS